jgi:predicted nuclease with RNAse H fold
LLKSNRKILRLSLRILLKESMDTYEEIDTDEIGDDATSNSEVVNPDAPLGFF